MIQARNVRWGPVYRWSLVDWLVERVRPTRSRQPAPANSRVFRDTRLERGLKSSAPWGERRWLATRVESSRLDSARLPSTPLDSTRPRPNHRVPATLTHSTQWRRPGFLCFSAAAAPRIRDLIYTDVAQVRTHVCTDVPTAWRILRAVFVASLRPFLLRSSLSFFLPLFFSVSTSRLWLCRSVEPFSRSRRGLLAGCFAPSGLPLARTRPRGYARA